MNACSGTRLDRLEIDEGAAFGDWQVWRRIRGELPVLFLVHDKRKIAIELTESSCGCLSYFDEAGAGWVYYGAGRPQKWEGNHVPNAWCTASTTKMLAEQDSQLGGWRFEFSDGLLRITDASGRYYVLVDRYKSTFVICNDSGDKSLHPMGYDRPSPAPDGQVDREPTSTRDQMSLTAIPSGQGAAWGEWTIWRGANRYGMCLQIAHRQTGFLIEISESSGVMALYQDQDSKVWMVSGSGSPQQAASVSQIVADPRKDSGRDLKLGNSLSGDWDCEFSKDRAKLTSRTDRFTLEIDRSAPRFVFRSKSGFETIHPAHSFHWPTEEELEEQQRSPRVEEQEEEGGGSCVAFWDENDDLASVALRIQRLGCPDPKTMRAIPEAITERAWEALDGPQWNEDAGFILANVGRGLWDEGDVTGLLLLRRLYHQALRHNLKERFEVMYSLCEKPLSRFFRDAEDAGFSESQIERNPMTPVEECYFGEGRDQEAYLQASCVLMAYRDHLLRQPDSPEYLPGMFALREAYALYYAGQIEAARQAMEWAMPLIDTLDPERAPDLSNAAGVFLQASAMAAEYAGDHDGAFDQLHDALRFLPSTGEHRAAAAFQMAQEFNRRGEYAEAIRWYGRALETRGAGADTLQVAEMELAALRAEMEGRPDKVKIASALIENYGIPASFAEQLPGLLSQMLAGEKLSDESVRQLMSRLPEWIDHKQAQREPGKAFSATLLMLKLALSVEDQSRLPMSYEAILRQADALAPAADAAEALEYEQLRSVVAERIGRRTPPIPTPHRLDTDISER